TGKPVDYQLAIYDNELSATEKQVLVNIWNHDPAWKTEYWVDGVSRGALEQTEGFDPLAYKNMLGPDLPKPRGFAEPKKTKHLFRAVVPASAKAVKVVATDRFGKTYTAQHTIGSV
ncbi:MAG: metallophosphoesterase, partial [Chitinophagaceae bacterium]